MTNINLRQASLKILEEIYNENIFLKEAIHNYFSFYQLEKQQRAFINRVVSGTIENQIKIDYIINQFSKVKTKKLKKPILYILRISVYQIFYMDSVPDNAICNEAVKLAKKRKLGSLASYTNGVLRNIMRNKELIKYPSEKNSPFEFLSIEYSIPLWLINYLSKQYSYDELKNICIESNRIPNITIRCNNIKIPEKEMLKSLKMENVEVNEGSIICYAYKISGFDKIADLKSFQKGYFQIQDESSMLVAEVASPEENNVILDLCAAPGGKTTHIAQLLNNNGTIYSRDISDDKLEKIYENCKRLGIENVVISKNDATVFDENLQNEVDIVIADVPCSGLGIISKKPDIKYNVTEEGIRNLINIQRNILDTASDYVKEDGTLIYSTCTINKEENIENIRYFLDKHSNFILDDIKFDEDKVDKSLITFENKCIQLLPNSNISDGFFIAKLKRID